VRVSGSFIPELQPDSFQYLSVAENMLKGHLGYTSLVHFDAERSFGLVPAPFVTFPMGFSLAIALLSLTGLSLEGAALLVSAASTVACVPLLAWIAGQMGLSRLLRNVVVACFVFNGAALQYGTAAMSEALFTFVVLLGLALLVAAQLRDGAGARWLWVAAGLAFGGAYFVRYAGLFFVIGLGLLVLRHLLASNRSLASGKAVAFAVASLAVMAGMARNILLIGDWRGGHETVTGNPSPFALLGPVRAAVSETFLGSDPGTLIPRALLIVAFLAAIGWLIWNHLRRRETQAPTRPVMKGILIDFVLLAAVYASGIFYASLTSVVSIGPRMFVPLTPMLLLTVGMVLQPLLATTGRTSRTTHQLPGFALAASFCLYVFLNFLVFRLPPVDRASAVASQMDVVSSDGTSARAAILDHVGANSVIVANNGQAVGYVLGLPTVSLVGPHYSSIEWNEGAIRDTVRRFDAGVIVISAPQPGAPDDSDFIPSSFVRQLALGEAPSWLQLAYRSSDVLVYVPRLIAP
jgi:hypothetical protein